MNFTVMNFTAIRVRIQKAGIYAPLRIHFILLIIALVFSYKWLKSNNALPETAETSLINLFVTITCWFAGAIVIISFISVLIPWIYFLLLKRKNKISLSIKSNTSGNTESLQKIEVSILHILKPLFGYIRLRFQYDNNISPKFSLVTSNSFTNFFLGKIQGFYNWPVKNIKEYEVENTIIYFEDFFQFFSFTSSIKAKNNFYTFPSKVPTDRISIQPKKTEDTAVRIDEIRKVEGELLSYKNFEDSDDVRRIVWKIYAKNKELVVRIPETIDPYASHIYFYASFYNAISNDIYSDFNTIFLDYFKTIIWNSFEQIYKQNELTEFIPDQQTKTFYADDVSQKIKYIISTCNWQKENNLISYFNKNDGSVLCISSLCDVKQLEEVTSRSGKNLTIIFIELGKIFSQNKVIDWLQWVFVKPSKQSVEKLQLAYNFSPLRKQISENEKKIRQLSEVSECNFIIISHKNIFRV